MTINYIFFINDEINISNFTFLFVKNYYLVFNDETIFDIYIIVLFLMMKNGMTKPIRTTFHFKTTKQKKHSELSRERLRTLCAMADLIEHCVLDRLPVLLAVDQLLKQKGV